MIDLSEVFLAAGAAAWGGVAYRRLLPYMTEGARARAGDLCPQPATVLIAAFPYYAGDRPGNLSLYARGEDYHRVLLRRLAPVCDFIRKQYPEEPVCPAVDSSPLPEREAAWLAGLGLRGRNGLLILPPYGSYVFLGAILTSAPLAVPERTPAPDCMGCGRCLAACPARRDGADWDAERCLSHLTQKKGALSPEEEAALAAHPLIWGCDLCQQACPYNGEAAWSPLPEFRTDCLDTLTAADLDGLTNRTFAARYGRRAFAWRGPAVLRRNLALHGRR